MDLQFAAPPADLNVLMKLEIGCHPDPAVRFAVWRERGERSAFDALKQGVAE